jgi:hypothetical protein
MKAFFFKPIGNILRGMNGILGLDKQPEAVAFLE